VEGEQWSQAVTCGLNCDFNDWFDCL
jgi:hypothetical protein